MLKAKHAFLAPQHRRIQEENTSLRKQVKRLKKRLKDEQALSSDFYEMYIQELTGV